MNRLIGALLLVAGIAFGEAGDPPSRVARLNYVSGAVSFQPAGVEDWAPAALNYPMTTGDHLWADTNSRAEIHIGSTTVQVDSSTAASFLNLDDRTVQIRLSQGSLSIRIRNLAPDEIYEVDTPNGAISLQRAGSYRIDADPDRQATTVTVNSGDAEIAAGGPAFPVHASQSGILTGADNPSRELRAAIPPDGFDGWCQERDGLEDSRPAPRYVSREMPGYEDLDANGTWQDDPGYGPVWTPRVPVGWAPYHYGHWRWVEPWGWTWIDDAPWGFAPFHYGRWAYGRNAWFWVPGPVVARPVYAPALVAFVGGDRWSAAISIGGGGGGVAWFPLGPREVYRPAYRVSPAYVNRVNVVNVTNVTVVNVRYVNQTAPGAVTAVSRTDFTTARPIGRTAVTVPASAVAGAPVGGFAPEIAPRRESIMAGRGGAVRPPPAALDRTVMTRSTPPPPPVSFAARQTALAANPGRPVDAGTLSTLRQSSPAQSARVRPAFSQTPVISPAPQSTFTPRPAYTDRPAEAQRQPMRQQQPVISPAPSAPAPPPSTYNRPAYTDRPARQQQQQPVISPAPSVQNPPPSTYNRPAYTDRPAEGQRQATPRQQPTAPAVNERRAVPPESREERTGKKEGREREKGRPERQ